jgi:hypothetical protein
MHPVEFMTKCAVSPPQLWAAYHLIWLLTFVCHCVLGHQHHRIWQKKAYVVQGCGERLQKVKQDFMNYDVEQLVSQASVQIYRLALHYNIP